MARNVIVITDGYIYDEEEVFVKINENLDNTSFFSFGIGSSVNRSLMEGIAGTGMGESFVVTEEEKAEETAEKFRTYIEAPVLTDIQVSFDGFDVHDTVPAAVPTLFAEKPVVLFGKWSGEPSGTVKITGKTGTKDFVQEIDVSQTVPSEKNGDSISTCERDLRLGHSDASCVAVHDTIRNPEGDSMDVDQPSPLPQGVSGLSVGGYLMGAEPEELVLSIMAVAVMLAGILSGRRKRT